MAKVTRPANYQNKHKVVHQEKMTPETANEIIESPKTAVELYHTTGNILDIAFNTLGTEMSKLRIRSNNSNTPLSDKEMKSITDTIKTLTAYEKHQADLRKDDEVKKMLANLSSEEFLKIAQEVLDEKDAEEGSENTQNNKHDNTNYDKNQESE